MFFSSVKSIKYSHSLILLDKMDEKLKEHIPPLYLHHETCRSRLSKKVDEGKITEEEADKIYQKWREKRKNQS